VGVAVRLTVDASQVCQDIGIGITGVDSKPYRAKAVETELKGKKLDSASIAKASQKAAAGIEALSDLHASSEYRAHLASVFTKRAIERALAKIR
jgi:carbon-monoxide dehydrogenase medium subunit